MPVNRKKKQTCYSEAEKRELHELSYTEMVRSLTIRLNSIWHFRKSETGRQQDEDLLVRTAELKRLEQACRTKDQEAAELSKRCVAHRREMEAKVRAKYLYIGQDKVLRSRSRPFLARAGVSSKNWLRDSEWRIPIVLIRIPIHDVKKVVTDPDRTLIQIRIQAKTIRIRIQAKKKFSIRTILNFQF